MKRLYYLDYIKIIAVIAVFTCHFTNGGLVPNNIQFPFEIVPNTIFNIYLGGFGVSLFFITSGAALMYVYEKECTLKEYYKKRFLGIYPMFWFAFLIAFCISFFRNHGIDSAIPKWKIIFTIFGCDGNALWWGPNFYQLGEWFLSVLICLYILFPLLRKCLIKNVWLTFLGSIGAYIAAIIFFKTTLPVGCFFVTRVPEFLFGMIFVYTIKKTNKTVLFLSIIAIVIISILPIDLFDEMIKILIVGVSSFYILAFVFQRIPEGYLSMKISKMVSKYLYPFYLVHHYTLRWVCSLFSNTSINRTEEVVLYISCWGSVIVLTYLLYKSYNTIFRFFTPVKNGMEK